jgi:hypothetical protein
MAADDETTSNRGPTPWFFLGFAFLAFSAASLVIGIDLETTCAATVITGPYPGTFTIGCHYPFQRWGYVFLYLCFVLILFSTESFVHDTSLRARGSETSPGVGVWSLSQILVALFVGATLVLAAALLGWF